jgi:ABC-2 type transport system permease protein
MNTITALWLRQVKRYYRSVPRMIGSLAQPLLFLVVFGFGFGPIFARAGAGDYTQFLVPGIIAMSVLFTSMFMGIEIIWDKQFGFLKETLVAPVSRTEIMIGRTLGGASVGVIQGLIVLLVSLIVGFKINLVALPLAILFMILIALLFTALGTAIASILDDMHGFQLVMNFLIMPIFFLSGALFPLENLPKALAAVTHFDPLTYGVDGLRDALIGTGAYSVAMNLTVLIVLTAIFLGIGTYLFSKIEI